jgi:FKBP-type peptidyl-prolyl cis-trans isomerase FklB
VKNLATKMFAIAALSVLSLTVSAADSKYKTQKERLSYAVGVQLGSSLKQQGITDIDAKVVGQAISDVMSGAKLKVSQQDMQAAVNTFQQEMVSKRQAAAKKEKAAGDAFRAKNKKRKGVKELPNGIQYEVLKAGKGAKPKVTDTVTVHYHGTLIDGKVFDSSVKRGSPATFPLNGVIKGWQEVLPLMETGAKWKVVIPPELAYGERGTGSAIGPNATLVFEIELLEIKK